MHVPSDRPLASWIRDLYSQHKIYLFYNSPEWKRLRGEVMEDHGFACEMCEARGIYTRATTVHHELFVWSHPGMALTRFIDEPDGTRREVLHPLCHDCHDEVHHRFKGGAARPRKKPITQERWD